MRQRLGPSGPFAVYARAFATALAQPITPPDFVITFAGGTLSEQMRFVIDGTDLRYIGNPRILVSVSAFTSARNTDAAPTTSALRAVVNGLTVFEGPAVDLPVGGGFQTVVAGGIIPLITNDLFGLRFVAPVTADLQVTQVVIVPVGDGENQ